MLVYIVVIDVNDGDMAISTVSPLGDFHASLRSTHCLGGDIFCQVFPLPNIHSSEVS